MENDDLFFAHESPRESQKEMIADGINALKDGHFLLAAAPTGIGKTAAALASALKVANLYSTGSETPKILFLTGRQSQHRIVVDTIREINRRMSQEFSKMRLVDIIGREGMCKIIDKSTGKCNCEPGVTESERRSLRSDLEDYIHSEPRHVDQILKYAERNGVCAWATARDVARSTNIIVCDYNHVFVEGVREASLPVMGVDLENTILVVDEAHNLPDRIRSGLERRITQKVFQRAHADCQEYKEELEKKEDALDIPESRALGEARKLEKQISALKSDPGLRKWFEGKQLENNKSKGDDIRIDTQDFLDVVSSAVQGIIEDDSEDPISRVLTMISRLLAVVVAEDEDLEEEANENQCTKLAEILEICVRYRNNSALALVFDEIIGEPRVTTHLLDPGVVSGPIFEQSPGSILMSGTLFPPEMYVDILRIPENRAICKNYPSGFPLGNRPVMIASDVTTKYSERERSMSSILEHIKSVIENTEGNVAIFAPSYSMLDTIYDHFKDNWNSKTGRLIKEEQRMSKRGVEGLISRLYHLSLIHISEPTRP